MNRLMTMILAVLTVLSCSAYIVNAEEYSSEEETNDLTCERVIYHEYISDYCDIVIPGSIVIDGTINELFRVFSDREKALSNFLFEYGWLMNRIKLEYKFEPISVENYMIYQNHWEEYIYDLHFDLFVHHSFTDLDYIKCAGFFDIFENNERNTTVLANYERLKTEGNDDYLSLIPLLPYNSPFVLQNTQNNGLVRLSGFNISNGVSYACQYAVTPNDFWNYYIYSQDCTNFCSQILEAGGYPQNNTGNQNSGWWHTVTPTGELENPLWVHNSSKSWSLVMNFIHYFGGGTEYTNHVAFSYAVCQGSFIACEQTGDNDWDHLGFVSDIGSNIGLAYRDYEVAQHTINYRRWVSEGQNNWELKNKWCIVIY